MLRICKRFTRFATKIWKKFEKSVKTSNICKRYAKDLFEIYKRFSRFAKDLRKYMLKISWN